MWRLFLFGCTWGWVRQSSAAFCHFSTSCEWNLQQTSGLRQSLSKLCFQEDFLTIISGLSKAPALFGCWTRRFPSHPETTFQSNNNISVFNNRSSSAVLSATLSWQKPCRPSEHYGPASGKTGSNAVCYFLLRKAESQTQTESDAPSLVHHEKMIVRWRWQCIIWLNHVGLQQRPTARTSGNMLCEWAWLNISQ